MLKCDFHLHSSEDPFDVLNYDAWELVDHAESLKYNVLALTLHRRLFCPKELQDYAASKGILMIPGIEFFVENREVLLLGVTPEDLKRVKSFNDLKTLREERGEEILVIAPHPFYGLGKCLGRDLEENHDLFDAVEFCHFYTSWWNPNLKAEKLSKKIGKPMVACSDTHQLEWMGRHYFLADAPLEQKKVFDAIRRGRVQNISRPLTALEIAKKTFWHTAIHDPQKIARRGGWILKEGTGNRERGTEVG